jgi:hypothetical protein
MRPLFFVLPLTIMTLVACATQASDDTDSDDAVQSPSPSLAGVSCNGLAPVHPVASCDGCTRDVCCEAVLDCEKATDCPQLRTCYQACTQGDIPCAESCRSKYSIGATALEAVDHCAQLSCAVPCGTARIGT